MTVLHLDFETRSAVDLKKTGAYVYAEDPTTDVWCLAYAFGDEPTQLWTPGQPCPPRVAAHVRAGGVLVAHNAAFERVIWHFIMAGRYGWPEPATAQWRCTMTYALAMALPASLENMLGALGTDAEKDKAGHRLMLTMSKPRRPRKGESGDKLYWWDDEERRQRLYSYCRQDVDGERAGGERLVRLRPAEQSLWHLDQKINDRGVYVDEKLCLRAKAIVGIVSERLDREMARVTEWDVTACSQVGALKTWLKRKGLDRDEESLDKGALGELLARHDLDAPVRRALELRQEAGKASVAKIDALLLGRSADGRARGLLQYHAASTGRWAGRRFQPQNIKRPEIDDVDGAIDIILKYPPERAVGILEMLYGPPLGVVGDCIRGMVRAAPGNKLVAADLANIEGRVLAWLAGEAWKLDAFRQFDAKLGPDLYKVTAGDLLGKAPSEVTKPERQALGKVPELASGYQGGHGAYLKMGATGETLRRIVEATRAITPPAVWAAAETRFDARTGLTVEEWTALRIVIDRWRAKHTAIKQYWRDLEDAAYDAVLHPGRKVSCGGATFRIAGSFLWLQLPSGRALCYPYPALVWKEMPWLDEDDQPVKKKVVSYKGVNDKRQWVTQYAYGGKWSENITQAAARDVLAEAMQGIEAAGYPIILHVHDEIVAEVPEDFGSVAEFGGLMADLQPWAAGLPVAAEGFEAERYRK